MWLGLTHPGEVYAGGGVEEMEEDGEGVGASSRGSLLTAGALQWSLPPQGVSASSLRVCNQRQRPHERSLCLIHSLVFTRICSFIEHLYIPGAGRLLGQTGESHCMDNSRLASPRVQG